MYDFVLILKILVLGLSFAGYAAFFTKRFGIHPLIAPAVVIPSIGVVMLLAGILNIMLMTVYLLYAVGIGLLIYTLIINKGVAGLLHPACMVPLAALGWMLWRLQGAQVYSIDNFHHWFKVLNVLLTRDALPNFSTPVITFQAYPTGSASYLYYALRLVGNREDLAIIAQLMMLVVFCLPLFALPKKGKALAWVVLAGFLAVALSRLYERDTLLVDDLQAFIGIGAIAMAYYYRDNLDKALLCLTPITIYMGLIKNSAMFFIAMTVVFFLVVRKDKQRGGLLKAVIYLVVLPTLVFFLWSRHVAQVFDSGLGYGMQAKHALNLSAYYSQAKAWGVNRLPELTTSVFKQAFGKQYFPGTLALVSTLAACLLTIPLWIGGKTREAIRSILLLAFAWLGYVLWEAGIVGMFAVSMPWDETETLACAERYMMTGIVYMFGLMTLSAVESVNHWPSVSKAAAKVTVVALALACGLMPLYYSDFPGQWGAPIRNNPVRSYFAALKEKYPVYFGEGCMYITDHDNQYYMLNKYIQTDFLSSNALPLTTAGAETPAEIVRLAVEHAKDFDFLIVDTANEEIMDGLSEAMYQGTFHHMKVFLGMDYIVQ